MPRSYESFISLVKSSSAEEFESVVERLIKCYHPSLREGNKKRLSRLFLYVLRYFDDCSHTASATDKISCCASSLYMLYKFDIEYSTRCMRALIRDLNRSHQKKPHAMFSFRVIAMLRLVAQLYPVTDIFHPVCTPMFFLAVQFLNDTHVTSVKDMARLLFLASILVDYISESKRYVPEMIAFMRGFLLTSVKNEEDERAPVCNFPVSLPHRHMLLINENCSGPNLTLTKIDLSCVFDEDATSFEDSDLNKALVLHCAFGLLSKLLQIYSVFPHSFTAIFAPVMDIIKRMPQDRYPQWLRSDIDIVQASYGGEIKKHSSFKQLQRPKQTKNMLEFLEPRTEDEGGSKITKLSKDSEKGTNAKKRLMHMYKKEMRGAMKELRKDNRFLASEKRQRVAVRDQERKEKVKELMSSLQQQQGDYNKMRAGRL
ncbi:hypothetical protein AB6A40_007620 [Gnathostoma spinigerum]|uniref:Nucleolar protein 14 n=1 Tax=Gnathostoma spinigerum TaxID=75299 RepID=A0ABD6ENP5_9BILA